MIRRILLFAFLFCRLSAGFAQPVSMGEFIYPVTLTKHIPADVHRTQWWHEFLEWPVNEAFFGTLIRRVDSGSITVMEPTYPFNALMTRSQVQQVLHPVVTQLVLNPETGGIDSLIVPYETRIDQIVKVHFQEEWIFDGEQLTFEKKVKAFSADIEKRDENGESRGTMPLFVIPIDASYNVNRSNASLPSDIRSTPPITFDHRYDNYFQNGNAYELGQAAFVFFLQHLKAAAASHFASLRTPVYPYLHGFNSNKYPLLLQQLDSVNRIRFLESWELDVNRVQFRKKVYGVVLINDRRTSSYDTIPVREYAFLPLNGYVPSPVITSNTINIPGMISNATYGIPPTDRPVNLLQLDSSAFTQVGITFMENVKNGKTPMYPKGNWHFDDYPWVPNRLPKSKEEVQSIFFGVDTVMTFDEDRMEQRVAIPKQLDPASFDGFRFYEDWLFDLKKLKLVKQVRGAGLLVMHSKDGSYFIHKLIGNIDFKSTLDHSAIEQPGFLLGKNVVNSIRIDMAEFALDGYGDISVNYPENIDPPLRYTFIQGLINAALEGKITVYNPDDPSRKMKKNALALRIASLKDSLFPKAVIPVDYLLVNKLIFNEDWYYDAGTMTFHKKVNSITLVQESRRYENDRIIYEDKKLFTVKLK